MKISGTPHMEDEGIAAFSARVNGANTYLEYGCGGSTVLAAKAGVRNIFAVDTSRDWLHAVRDGTKDLGAQITLSHCDLGNVREWGYPADNTKMHNFHRYAVLPWEATEKAGLVPDLVLVDGRFRVASFLYSLLCAQPGTTILFDDYTDRPQYHIVEQFCPMMESHGRMGVFKAGRDYRTPDLVRTFSRFSVVAE